MNRPCPELVPLAALIALAPVAQAQSVPQDPLPLSGTVVTATRGQRDAFDLPYVTDVQDEHAIARRGQRNTPQLLADQTGVLVQETSFGQGSPYLRGFTGFRNVFLIDGIRLNNSVFRDGPNQYWNTVDSFSVDHLEVVKGPASVLYGSDAIGGAVQVFTRRPDAYGKGGPTLRLHQRYASAENSYIVRADASVAQGDEMGLRVGLTGKRFGDLRGGKNTGNQPETGYDEWDADLTFERFLDDSWSLLLGYQQVHQNDVPRTHRTVFAKPFAGTTVGSDLRRDLDQERQLGYAQVHGRDLGDTVQEAHFSLSWQRQEEERDRVRGSGARELQGLRVDTLGLYSTFVSASPIGRLTYGFDYYHDSVDSFSTRNAIQGPVGDDASYDLLGAYLQDEIEISDVLDVFLGTRLQWASLEAGSVQDPSTGNRIAIEDDWSQLVSSGRFVWQVVRDALHVFGGISQGFRAPNLSDLTRLDSARTNEVEIPSPGLEAERTTSYELGLRTRNRTTSSQLAVFYTDIQDAIVRVPTGVTTPGGEFQVTKDNVGDGYVFGVELEGDLALGDGWSVAGNGTYLDGKLDTFRSSAPVASRDYIDRLMPLTLRGSVGWGSADGSRWAEAGLVWADKADRLSTRDRGDTSRIPPGGTPDYLVLHLRGGFRLGGHTQVSLGLENLTNEDYRVHGSGQNSPGRSLVVGLTVTL